MATIFNYLQNFIKLLLPRNPDETEKRKQLKAIYNQLKQISPAYYKRSTSQVLPGFAMILLELVHLLQPICDLFRKTVCNEDSRLAERYRDHLVKIRLPESQQLLFGNFTYQAMKERVLSAANPGDELKDIHKEFQNFMNNFSSHEFDDFDIEYTQTERLINLCTHNFKKIFSFFDPAFDPDYKDRRPFFNPIMGEKVFQELLDLYFILAGVNISQGFEKNINFLVDRLERDQSTKTKQTIKKTLNRIVKLLSQNLNREIILNLIRIIKQNPNLNPQTVSEQLSYLDSYKNRLSVLYNRDRERIERERTETAVTQDLKTLFAGSDLLDIEGYKENIAKILRAKGFDSFTQIKPLRILKSFILAKFEKELKDSVKKLLVEGYFENRTFQNALSNIYYRCEGYLMSITQFEESLTGTGQVSLKTIKKYLEQHEQGKQMQIILNKLVETIDGRSKHLIEEGTNLFYNLGILITEILNDVKQKTPVHVINIKVINGKNNRDFLSTLITGYNSITRLVRIMKHFTLIHKVTIPSG